MRIETDQLFLTLIVSMIFLMGMTAVVISEKNKNRAMEEKRIMAKKKTPKFQTPDTPMSEVKAASSQLHDAANNESWADFAARAESKLPPPIEEFPAGEAIVGVLESIESIENKKQKTDSEALVINTPTGRRRFWGFGLLMYELEKNNVQSGMKIFVRKSVEKKKMENGQLAWGVEFYAE